MISNPGLIFYACIAKGPIILTEFSSSEETGIEDVAQKCIEKTPPNHSIFSHAVGQKTYTFLIDDPCAYFVIADENLEKSESLWFLNRVKIAFEELIESNPIKDYDNLTPRCFQGQFLSVFREILGLDVDLPNSLMEDTKDSRNPSLDSSKGKTTVVKPLLPKASNALMKKKKRIFGEANGDHHHHHIKNGGNGDNKVNNVGENGHVVVSREFTLAVSPKNGGFYLGDSKQKAKQIWRKHVWVVLTLDLVVCAVLFGIWLWVCRGFQCIDG